MAKVSKRFKAVKKEYGVHEIQPAVKLVKTSATAKFDESVDISFSLNLEKKHTIRDTVVFPNKFGRSAKILVFAKGEKAEDARSAGADFVGDDDFIQKISDGWLDFDVAIATPDMMKNISKIAKILGTKGLMPNPKAKTVTNDIKEAVGEIKSGRREFRANEHGVINFSVGKASMTETQIAENAKVFFEAVLKKKPTDLKGDYIRKVFLTSTMGKSVELNKKAI